MADAGKVMIFPRGNYNETSVYEVLDLVNHKGASWVAKQNTINGIEPSEANSEYWFKMAGHIVVNNLNTSAEGYVLDARQGKLLHDELAVERARINQFTKLAEGSTTGDAELFDARVGADGETYENLGEAVRTQFANVKSDLSNFWEKGENLLDFSKMSFGAIKTDGSISDNTALMHSEPIRLPEGTTFSSVANNSYDNGTGIIYIAYYNNDDTFQGRETVVGQGNFTKTMSAYRNYIRVVVAVDSEPFMLNKGEELLPYVPFSGLIKEEAIPDQTEKIEEVVKDNMSGLINKSFRFSSLPIPNMYTSKSVQALDGTGTFNHDNVTVEQLYSLYDTLMTQHPDYITKKDYGLDQSGTYHIYGYKFSPERAPLYNNRVTPLPYPKIMLRSGIHGNGEDAGDKNESICGLYFFFDDLCNHWNEDESLAYLRWNVEFVVLPIQNPWGVDNKSRRNSRLVDLNRNFPYGWYPGTYGANDYSGESALSEAESKAIKLFVEENTDVLCNIEFHTTGHIPSQDTLVYCSLQYESEQYYVAESLIRQLSYKWDNENIANLTPMNWHGYVSDGDANGIPNQWIDKVVGIPSLIVETFPNFHNSGIADHSLQIMKMGMDEIGNSILNSLRHYKHRKLDK